ncbi:hypothetical protein [Cellulosimicrobium arenosum]|uniref:Uncharacterized protein n=1 Tax=Cellulosimicrobium arenosum TaxID=2708133 RepID=A0A927G901_9MICO|nr:hypothetical protein [Cellulosimicrobium arenosum]MBD8078642.1 hypothetical protein [Cellulosimicrobium arenosum]
MVALVLCTMGLVSGCTTPSPAPKPTDLSPTVMETPELVWLDDREPSSTLEDDERVRTIRAAEIGRTMAWNSGDFTIAQLTESATRGHIAAWVRAYRSDGEGRPYDPGPAPFEPLELLEEFEDGGGVVQVCKPSLGLSWMFDTIDSFDERHGQIGRGASTWRVTVVREDGRLKVADRDPRGGESCDVSGVAVGLFDPEPAAPDVPPEEPVRAPLFESS